MDGGREIGDAPSNRCRREALHDELATVVALSLGLAGVMTAAKFVLLPFPVESASEFARWLLRLSVVAAQDIMFVAALAFVSVAAAWLANRYGRTRLWRIAVVGAFQIAALYAVASVAMFRMTMVPLTVELLSFAGGPVLMASSIKSFLTAGSIAALLGVPVLIFAFARWRLRGVWQAWGEPIGRRVLAAAVILIACHAAVCRGYVRSHWTDPNRWERRIAVNSHSVFLASCVRALGSTSATWRLEQDLADDSDFCTPRTDALRPSESRQVYPGGPAGTQAAGESRPRNLIVIVLESVGVEYLSLYGSPHATTRELEKLIDGVGGIVFDNVYAHAPSSPKGLVALAASTIPRVDWKLITRDSLEFSVPLISEVLSAQGYRTAYLHSGYWSWKRRDEFLAKRGVDRVIDAATLPAANAFSWGVSDDEMFRAALQFIDEDRTRPIHLLLWTIETHHPYVASDEAHDFGVEDEELGRYLAAIRAADRRIARLVAELRSRGLEDSTVIAITGDHGESFGRHGQRVHSFGIYEENVHVPLVILHPSLRSSSERISAVCQQVDIPATLLGMLDIPRPSAWQGRDVLKEGPLPRAYFFSTGNEVLVGLRDGRLKYHYHVTSGHEELFDLDNDPHEEANVAALHQVRVGEYRRRVAGIVKYQREFLARHGSP